MPRANSKLFKVGDVYSVDPETGEAVPVEGGGMMMLPGPPGTCEWCHVAHNPAHPHDAQSLPYQMKYYTLNGRSPTWSDAMAHCTPEVRAAWKAQLREVLAKHGLPIPDDVLGD
jgi:hypothetical protein